MVKAVVTGGAGFIGSHLAELLAKTKNADVTVIDDLSSGKQANVPKSDGIKFVNASFESAEALTELRGADAVFHLAGIVGVPYSIAHPEETRRVNVDGSAALLEECERAGVRSFVFASSASVYGNPDEKAGKQKESDALHPESPYAESKVKGEKLVAAAAKRGGLRACSLRLFNVYGPRQTPGGAYAAAIPTFIDAALRGRDITVFGGAQTRDFVFVRDVARAFDLASQKGGGDGCNGKAFNIATGKSVSIVEIAGEIVALAGSKSKISLKPERSGEVRFSEADVSLAASELGFRAGVPLGAGLKETLEYFKNV